MIDLLLLIQFNNFLWVCWFLGKNISNFVPPAWKLYNPYCHNIYSGEDRIWYIRQFKVYQVVGWFTCETPGHYRQTNVLCWWDEKAGSEIRNSSKGFWHSFLEQSLPKFNLTTSVTNDWFITIDSYDVEDLPSKIW